MDEKTLGQVGYEADDAAMPHLHCGRRDGITDELRAAMEASAEAVANAVLDRRESYPRQGGDITAIGPECFASTDPAVISWKGENYYRPLALPDPPGPDGGMWARIAFMGHVELTGYVTEITIGGQAAFHVDLPEKLWGGNPLAWREYAASALYSREPVTEEAVRGSWEAARRARLAWQEREQRRELEAAEQDDGDDAEPF